MPERVQRKRTPGWRMPEGAVYVGRPTRWGNPFRIYRKRHLIGPSWVLAREAWGHLTAEDCWAMYISSSSEMSPSEAVRPFADLLRCRQRDEPERLAKWLAPLVGRDLACWCPLAQPCHADVLLDLAASGDSAATP